MISKTLVSRLLLAFASTPFLVLGGNLNAQASLPTLSLPWGTYQAQEFAADPNIYRFENVRFGANPPRFSAPSFPAWTNSSVQPVSDGRNCIQVNITGMATPPGRGISVGNPEESSDIEESEDCLFLDIYVPRSAFEESEVKPMPVVVWVYGGAFAFGSKQSGGPLGTGQSMLRETNYQTVFVAGNYRLGAFGWLAGDYMQKEATPNAGLHDQALLFEWVQKYIGLVHGDSSKVSAWGESAGASSILHHLIREDGSRDPNFKTFAVQSPAFEWAWDNSPNGTLDQVYQNFSRLAGCGDSFDIDCLRASGDLVAANQNLFATVKQTGLFPVGPSVDGEWVTTIPTLSFANGKYWKDIDSAIVSHCLNESYGFFPEYVTTSDSFAAFLAVVLPGSELAPQRAKITKQYDCEGRFGGDFRACIATVVRDFAFTCNTRDLFYAYPEVTYMMRYGFPWPSLSYHASDLIALFSNSFDEVKNLLENLVDEDLADLYASFLVKSGIMKAYQTYFASFALSGDDPNSLPQPDEIARPDWPVADGSGDLLTNVLAVQYRIIGNPFSLGTDDQNTESICEFWTTLASEIVSHPGDEVRGPGQFGEL
ncbi:putative carboxylesterase family protein [Rosellinia necatrix]|uniref:Putative carboxylesterase family protein n=1 Tax=Rosellinia necatrix TaxID=77044 RepID=A0A1S7UM27_ROSNE|nr:putative carboxylesterase family protein [Rosellinia necatrix]